MKTYRVAMVVASPFPANHGTPAAVREACEALARLGHSIHVVTYHFGQEIPVQGVKIHRVPALGLSKKLTIGPTIQKPFLDLLLLIKLCRVVKSEKIDLIHAHNYEGALVGYFAKKLTRRPLLYNAINNMVDELPSYRFIKPRILARGIAKFFDWIVPRLADHIIAVSEELSSFLVQKRVSPRKISTIPLGVVVDPFMGKDPLTMRQRHMIGSKPLLVYTGVLDSFQRIDYLLKAMKNVIWSCKDTMLLFAGTIVKERDLETYRALAEELDIQNHVIFTINRPFEEMPLFLASADVAVIPRPDCPGFPVKLLNYMAAGKAIVVFKGSAKGLRHMYNGYLAEDHDWEMFGRGIMTLIKDPGLARALGENARRSVREAFDWNSLVKGISVVYDGILEANGGKNIAIDSHRFHQFIRRSYAPVLYERRQHNMPVDHADRRKHHRRCEETEINFLERRKMIYE
jgi:1,2-diacylglycerol 3-alpha-glucosyltransferase